MTSLWLDHFTLVCPQDSHLPLGASQLAAETFISYNRTYAPHYHTQFTACCNRLGFTPEVVHECNNMHSILSLVENGLGIAIVPASVQYQYRGMKLSFTDLTDMPVTTETVMAYHAQTEHPALDVFKMLAQDAATKTPAVRDK